MGFTARFLLAGAVALSALLAVLSGAPPARADIFIDAPTTLDTTLLENVQVGTKNPAPFTVRVVDGGYLDYRAVVSLFNRSHLAVEGGYVDYLFSYDTSLVSVTGGQLDNLAGDGTSRVSVSGGAISSLFSFGQSSLEVTSGLVGQLVAIEHGTATATGILNNVQTYGAARVTLVGGSTPLVSANDDSRIDLRGGLYQGGLDGSHSINAYDNAVVRVFGTDLRLSNPIPAFGNGQPGTVYSLTGTLADGTTIDTGVFDASENPAPQILLINVAPEPHAAALLLSAGLPGLSLVRYCARRRNRR